MTEIITTSICWPTWFYLPTSSRFSEACASNIMVLILLIITYSLVCPGKLLWNDGRGIGHSHSYWSTSVNRGRHHGRGGNYQPPIRLNQYHPWHRKLLTPAKAIAIHCIQPYLDASNLYGWGMSQSLPTSNFKSLKGGKMEELDVMMVPNDSSRGYILECDLGKY